MKEEEKEASSLSSLPFSLEVEAFAKELGTYFNTTFGNRYGNVEEFMQRFSPTLQLRVAVHVEYAHMGPIPTLAQVGRCYGEPTAEAILCFELEDHNRFAGTKTKLEIYQQKEVARIILTEFYYLKVSEVLPFFFRLKSGRYGSFYGSVDAIAYKCIFFNTNHASHSG